MQRRSNGGNRELKNNGLGKHQKMRSDGVNIL